MRKTFKSVCVPGLELNISPSHQGIALTVTMDEELCESQGITLSHEDAPALALAILEAGGFVGDENMFTGLAVANLRDHVTEQERITAEAKDKAELEAEALKLFNASLASCGLGQVELFDALNPLEQQRWLAVARKAREMAKEATK